MAYDSDVIEIIIKAKTDEADAATAKLDQLGDHVITLKQAFDAQLISQSKFDSQLGNLDQQINKTKGHITGLKDEIRDLSREAGKSMPRLDGAERAATKARLGLAGANILQDAAQGGIPSTLNNFLGLAGDRKAVALGGELLESAGGAKALGAAFGTVTILAGGAFAIINQGLKTAKLGWSDLGDVADQMVGGAFSGAAKQTETAFESAYNVAASLVETVADYTLGWSDATTAVRDHKDEIERSAKALLAYGEAQKIVGKLQSDQQKENQQRGQRFGEEFANAAKGDVTKFIDELVTAKMGPGNGPTSTVKEPVLDDKNRPTGKTRDRQTNQRESEVERITMLLAGAISGEVPTMNALVGTIQQAGIDSKGLEGAASGLDPKKQAADSRKAADDEAHDLSQRVREADQAANEKTREFNQKASELARPLQDRFNLSTASGGVVTDLQVRSKLMAGGVDRSEADQIAGAVLENLEKQYSDAIRERAGKLGTDATGARQSIVDDAVLGAAHDRDSARRELGLDKDHARSSQVIGPGSGLRDSIQGSIRPDDSPRLMVEVLRQSQQKLDRSNELLQMISRNVGGPARFG